MTEEKKPTLVRLPVEFRRKLLDESAALTRERGQTVSIPQLIVELAREALEARLARKQGHENG
ncbi:MULTISPECIES: hypothetical protein [Ralstonia]|uniref:Uncharacterized protein n=2 Tax=Ralstonia TaxID=48736 RepID=A0AAD2BUS4_9RALS|nr:MULTISPECIES: hypothetical protein [Ralstonia]NMV39922.1 hypothetical protein [Ralstonia insidiosa]CAJ0807481.1 hypothetical protein R77560_04581 [Ralstonia sp. LMG 18095]